MMKLKKSILMGYLALLGIHFMGLYILYSSLGIMPVIGIVLILTARNLSQVLKCKIIEGILKNQNRKASTA